MRTVIKQCRIPYKYFFTLGLIFYIKGYKNERWRRGVEADMKEDAITWLSMERTAQKIIEQDGEPLWKSNTKSIKLSK